MSTADSEAAQGELTGRHHRHSRPRTGRWWRLPQGGAGAGGKDDGAPGEGLPSGYYAAFVLDPDGNNIEAVYHGEPTQRGVVKVTFSRSLDGASYRRPGIRGVSLQLSEFVVALIAVDLADRGPRRLGIGMAIDALSEPIPPVAVRSRACAARRTRLFGRGRGVAASVASKATSALAVSPPRPRRKRPAPPVRADAAQGAISTVTSGRSGQLLVDHDAASRAHNRRCCGVPDDGQPAGVGG